MLIDDRRRLALIRHPDHAAPVLASVLGVSVATARRLRTSQLKTGVLRHLVAPDPTAFEAKVLTWVTIVHPTGAFPTFQDAPIHPGPWYCAFRSPNTMLWIGWFRTLGSSTTAVRSLVSRYGNEGRCDVTIRQEAWDLTLVGNLFDQGGILDPAGTLRGVNRPDRSARSPTTAHARFCLARHLHPDATDLFLADLLGCSTATVSNRRQQARVGGWLLERAWFDLAELGVIALRVVTIDHPPLEEAGQAMLRQHLGQYPNLLTLVGVTASLVIIAFRGPPAEPTEVLELPLVIPVQGAQVFERVIPITPGVLPFLLGGEQIIQDLIPNPAVLRARYREPIAARIGDLADMVLNRLETELRIDWRFPASIVSSRLAAATIEALRPLIGQKEAIEVTRWF